ncbi:hypothetical protein DOTSEDRAFT_78005 [Dothistroma septosporum NZE10]|uniref:F-box domain-containing protein n=1 Tax=Dothistroma septosporum (strain NZE10 / CBS 128990) TaxID=675120 RepID=N1Q003_DOTSN|nr:hypothetical protein DOTSEDRAFT_78005 [Dothistroma septosporum NZE10]
MLSSMEAPTPFRLLSLPPELRDLILAFTLLCPLPISPRVFIPRDAFVLRLPAVTQVNRQIRKESLPLYFAVNTFQFNIKDVIEAPLHVAQDLRYEKKLLTFGAWCEACEAAGSDSFLRIRKFELKTGSAVSAPAVTLDLGKKREVRMEVRCYWQGGARRRPRLQCCEAPGRLVEVVRGILESNEGRGLLPGNVIELCGEIQGSVPRMLHGLS